MTTSVCGPGRTPFRRYEAAAFDASEACFTYPDPPERGWDFAVSYVITSDDIVVRMNLRSVASNSSSSILRRRLLPAKFKRFYERSGELTEPYEIEFCASSELIGDNTGASTPASAVISDISEYNPTIVSGLLFYVVYFFKRFGIHSSRLSAHGHGTICQTT